MALRTLRIFISSPGDVAEERLIARRVIGRLASQLGDLVRLDAVAWERAPLVATASFQDQLVRPSETDITVLILWSRLGTPLPSHLARDDGSTYASGTEFEFEDAMAGYARSGAPRVLAYRKTAPIVPPSELDALEESVSQQQAMERFVAKWFRNEADGTLKAAFHNFATPADFEDVFEAHLAQLVEQLLPPGIAARGAAPTWRDRSPFRGLEVFEPQHAPVFFGRTAATASVLAKLRAQGQAGKAFVLIVGMSGGGKSSLVRAGVLPLMLQPGVIGDATEWRSAVMRPSDGQGRPVHALQRAIDEAIGGTGDMVERLGPGVDLVVVVDQLEEAFSDERVTVDARDAFFARIDTLARSGRVWIVATMRSDAYPLIAASPTLVALKEGDGQYDLLPPNLREIGQIIRFPAAAAGLRFEARATTAEKLDDVIRDAAASNPNALPLLQFLLEALYQRRNAEDVLTFRAYEELGGVEGALAQRAETVLASVSDGAKKALPLVLRELVTFGTDDDSKALRRVAPRTAFESREANELVDALVEARLLVSTLGADGTSAISLAHEALLEFWPRLKAWKDEDRELLLVHARLAAATREWEKNARNHDLLLARGKPLAEARGLVDAGVRLTPDERALLVASEGRARRFAILRNGAIASLAVLAAVAGIAAWKATSESKRAQVQATTAQRTTDFMVGLFANADPEQSRGDQITVREVLNRGVRQIGSELAGEPGVKASLMRAMGEAYTGLGLFQDGRGVLLQSVELSKNASTDINLRSRLALASNLFEDGKYEQAERLFREVKNEATRRFDQIDDVTGLSQLGIAECLRKQMRIVDAEIEYRSALEANLVLNGPSNALRARLLDGYGALYANEGKFEQAESLMLEAVRIDRAIFGSMHGKVSSALSNLGWIYFQSGLYEKATAVWAETLDIDRQVYGVDHSYLATTLNNLGRVELLTNRTKPAKEHIAEALRILEGALSAEHDDLVAPLNSLGMIALGDGDLPGAKMFLDRALTIASKHKHALLNQVLGNQAQLAAKLGHVDVAKAYLAQARAELSGKYGASLQASEAWRAAVLDLVDAEIRVRSGSISEGRQLLSESLPLLEKRFGKHNFYTVQASKVVSGSILKSTT